MQIIFLIKYVSNTFLDFVSSIVRCRRCNKDSKGLIVVPAPFLYWSNRETAFKEAEKAPITKVSIPKGNVLVEGDNLEVMKLMCLSSERKVKLVYFDPPFMFRNLELEWLSWIKSKEKPSREDWFTYIYSRLLLARKILSEDGAIFASIGFKENHTLRVMMDEIFGKENFVQQITVRSGTSGLRAKKIPIETVEYLLIYAKNINSVKLEGFKGKDKNAFVEPFLESIWQGEEVRYDKGVQELKDIFKGEQVFGPVEPVGLIKRMMKFFPSKKYTILDVFAGSGTTAQAVLELNKEDGGSRNFILIQRSVKLPAKSIGETKGFNNIFEITRERIRYVIEKTGETFKIIKI